MKKIYIVASLLMMAMTTVTYGQNKNTEKADQLFETYQYVDAIDAYLDVVNNNKADAYVYKQLGDSYYNLFNMEEASKWYAKAINKKQDAETYYRYAQTLKSQGKYKEANEQMDVFANMMPNDQRAKKHLENPNYIPHLVNKSELFENLHELPINSKKQSDFGAVLSNDNTLYFVSSRDNASKTDKWANQPYLDIFQSTRKEDGSYTDPILVKSLNTNYHDGPVSVSQDGKTMFLARDGHGEGMYKKVKKSRVKVAQQVIYKAKKVDGEWTDLKPVSFNSSNYSVSHPSLSPDGKTLYFASNMPGGEGDTDIWKVSITENGYGKPENLGKNVNTPGKEGFPFIAENNILYFSSNGRQGFGGYDIFKADLSKNEEAENMGSPINTKNDDFSFSINEKEGVVYFSSNRDGADNIYTAVAVCHSQLLATIKNSENNKAVSQAKVVILDAEGNAITTKNTSGNGEVSFDTECETSYTLQVSKEGFEAKAYTVEKSKNPKVTATVLLDPLEKLITDTEVKLKNIYFEFNKSNITEQGAQELNKLVDIMKAHPEMNIFVKSHTDTKGSVEYNRKLSERRAQATIQYLVSKGINKNRLTGKGFGSSEPLIDCKGNCTKEEDAKNRRSEFMIVKK